MKLNEIIELNRESILRIEQYTNTQEAMKKISNSPYKDKSNINIEDDEDPFAEKIDEEEIERINEERIRSLNKLISKAFWIWLYPVEKLSYSKVEEILKPYFNDEEKAIFLAEKYKEFSNKSIEIREKYLEEQKNLKALTK